jgi:hypothetical protein
MMAIMVPLHGLLFDLDMIYAIVMVSALLWSGLMVQCRLLLSLMMMVVVRTSPMEDW